jgi:hypothetical protein
METFSIQKIDTNLYIKGLSGQLVFKALYGILAAFLLFTGLYILTGVFLAIAVCIPLFFVYLYRLNRIQKKLGPQGWDKKQNARKLPQFILIKRRIYRTQKR